MPITQTKEIISRILLNNGIPNCNQSLIEQFGDSWTSAKQALEDIDWVFPAQRDAIARDIERFENLSESQPSYVEDPSY